MGSTLYKWDGKLLVVDGKLATSNACCCDTEPRSECCKCDNPPLNTDLQVDITGSWSWSGLVPEDPQPEDNCWKYRLDDLTPDAGCNLPLFNIEITCPNGPTKTINDVNLLVEPGDLQCEYGVPSLVSATCEPFRLEWTVSISDGADGCDCNGGSITVIVTLP